MLFIALGIWALHGKKQSVATEEVVRQVIVCSCIGCGCDLNDIYYLILSDHLPIDIKIKLGNTK